jgi:succinate dehydrogenase hydrophobic anchor subunit
MADPAPGGRQVRWGAVSGIVVYGWVVAWAVGLVVLQVGRSSFNRYYDLLGNAVARVALAVVVVAALFHTLDGLRRLSAGSSSAMRRHDETLQVVCLFVTFALGVPAALVILWPRLDGVIP